MEIGYISTTQLPLFSTLLLPETAAALGRGELICALGLVQEGIACGAVAGMVKDGVFRLQSFYVSPNYRRKGGGRLLLETLIKLLKDLPEVFALEISFTVTLPEHETLMPFLHALGFCCESDQGETLYRFTLKEIMKSPFFAGKSSLSNEVIPFSQVPDSILAKAQRVAANEGVPLPELPLDSPELERQISVALVRNGAVEGFVVFDRSCMGWLTLSCVWSGNGDASVIPQLFRGAFARLVEYYPPDTPMAVQAVIPAAAGLIRTLLPNAVPFSFTYRRSFAEDSML